MDSLVDLDVMIRSDWTDVIARSRKNRYREEILWKIWKNIRWPKWKLDERKKLSYLEFETMVRQLKLIVHGYAWGFFFNVAVEFKYYSYVMGYEKRALFYQNLKGPVLKDPRVVRMYNMYWNGFGFGLTY